MPDHANLSKDWLLRTMAELRVKTTAVWLQPTMEELFLTERRDALNSWAHLLRQCLGHRYGHFER